MYGKRWSKSARAEERSGWLFVLPFLVLFAVYKLYPMVYGLLISFWNQNSVSHMNDRTFVGFANYAKVLTSRSFWQAFGHSFQFSAVYTAAIMAFGVLFAVLLNREFKGRVVVRTCFYIPYVTNMIAVGVVFKYLLNPGKGPVNALWRAFGLAGPKWLLDPHLALPVTALVGVWVGLAFNIITVLAALQEIPVELQEVADLEGVSFWQRIRYVVFPSLIPTLFMLLTISIVNSFRNYTTIVALTNGGPGTSSTVVSLQIYNDAFLYQKFSIGSTEGVLFAIVVIAINHALSCWRTSWENK